MFLIGKMGKWENGKMGKWEKCEKIFLIAIIVIINKNI
jgi:hypothetical protein